MKAAQECGRSGNTMFEDEASCINEYAKNGDRENREVSWDEHCFFFFKVRKLFPRLDYGLRS